MNVEDILSSLPPELQKIVTIYSTMNTPQELQLFEKVPFLIDFWKKHYKLRCVEEWNYDLHHVIQIEQQELRHSFFDQITLSYGKVSHMIIPWYELGKWSKFPR